jgi:carbamoyltransferase
VSTKAGQLQNHAALASAGQQHFESLLLKIVEHAYQVSPTDNLILTGGCALNSTFNGKVLQDTLFEELHVPPAPGDDGTAVGAALLAWSLDTGSVPERGQVMPYLGTTMDRSEVERCARYSGFRNTRRATPITARHIASRIAEGAVVAVAAGRAEFGPRALGNRSILADPRDPEMGDRINSRVKFRETFRPFAPAVLHSEGGTYFEHYRYSPYMSQTLRWRPEHARYVPAVVHHNGTGRVQSVIPAENSPIGSILESFAGLTGIPILLNTSLNVMGKPLCSTAGDAISCFTTSDIDLLLLDDLLIDKRLPDPNNDEII